MRVCLILLASSLAICAAGCRSGPSGPSIANGQAITENPVGPIPGGYDNVPYATNPLAGNAVALQAGRRLFDWYNCSGCHGGHGGGGMGPSLRDPVWLYGDHDGQIFDSIAHGRSQGMPAWGAKIPPEQIWQLVAYIKSLGTPQEPDPPKEPADEQVPDSEQYGSSNPGTPIFIAPGKQSHLPATNNGSSK